MTRLCSRRHLLAGGLYGLGPLALVELLRRDGLVRAAPPVKPPFDATYDLTPKAPHHAPKARAMISLFMIGGPSHLDLFDPKPALAKYAGKNFPGEVKYDNPAQASPIGGVTNCSQKCCCPKANRSSPPQVWDRYCLGAWFAAASR